MPAQSSKQYSTSLSPPDPKTSIDRPLRKQKQKRKHIDLGSHSNSPISGRTSQQHQSYRKTKHGAKRARLSKGHTSPASTAPQHGNYQAGTLEIQQTNITQGRSLNPTAPTSLVAAHVAVRDDAVRSTRPAKIGESHGSTHKPKELKDEVTKKAKEAVLRSTLFKHAFSLSSSNHRGEESDPEGVKVLSEAEIIWAKAIEQSIEENNKRSVKDRLQIGGQQLQYSDGIRKDVLNTPRISQRYY